MTIKNGKNESKMANPRLKQFQEKTKGKINENYYTIKIKLTRYQINLWTK